MVTRLKNLGMGVVALTGLLGWAAFPGAPAWAQCAGRCGGACMSMRGHEGHGGAAHEMRSAAEEGGHAAHPGHTAPGPARPALPARGPHGGQLAALPPQYLFEAVYEPRQIRLYLYGPSREPLSLRGVQGEALMRLRDQDAEYRFPLTYRAPRGGRQQDYLVAAADFTRVRDGEMSVTFVLQRLPNPQRPVANFTQTFALSHPRTEVVAALLEESDQEGLARQKVCPVTGNRLGSHGTPVKLLVGGQPLYLCCRACIEEVQKNPDRYAPSPQAAGEAAHAESPAQRPVAAQLRLIATQASAADREAIHIQGVCPVLGTRLGDHGNPVKITRGDQSIFVCCRACVRRVEENPLRYFAASP